MRETNFLQMKKTTSKDRTYQEAMKKVWNNNPDLVKSQMQSNIAKKRWRRIIKANQLFILFSISFFIVLMLTGILSKVTLRCYLGVSVLIIMIITELFFFIYDNKFWNRMANLDFQLYRKWKFEFAKVGYNIS